MFHPEAAARQIGVMNECYMPCSGKAYSVLLG